MKALGEDRVVVIMRGLPGSGKSTLARWLLTWRTELEEQCTETSEDETECCLETGKTSKERQETAVPRQVIASADDFFCSGLVCPPDKVGHYSSFVNLNEFVRSCPYCEWSFCISAQLFVPCEETVETKGEEKHGNGGDIPLLLRPESSW